MDCLNIISEFINQAQTDYSLHNVFGAEAHQFKVHEPLSIHKIKQFENKFSVTLPEDYTKFLTKLSNGGPGPGYGILKFEETSRESVLTSKFLKHPFPHSKKWNNGYTDFTPDKDFLILDSEKERLNYFSDHHIEGSIRISDFGCGESARLIISGKQSGNIWIDQRANGGGIWPVVNDSGHHLSFCHWYQLWINQLKSDEKTGNS